MSDETFLSVRGEARLDVEPEIATLDVTVGARDRDRHRAVEILAERIHEVDVLIKGYGDAVERLETQLVRVQPLLRDSDSGKGGSGKAGSSRGPVGYLAEAGFAVTVGDFAVLGEMVTALAAQDLVTLGGPAWKLRPDSPIYREVRLAAVRDSLSRARDYAGAFGSRITGLTEAADTGLLGDSGGWRGTSGGMVVATSRAATLDGHQVQIDLAPAALTVLAQIEARFTMTRPVLGSN